MIEAYELFNNTYVAFRQKKVEKCLNYLLELDGRVQLVSTEPVTEQLSETALLQIMTTDELREKAGLPKQEVAGNSVADALGTISPLVATKVLETMTAEEVRAIVGLGTPKEGIQKKTTTEVEEFSKQDEELLLEQFAKIGKDANEVESVYSRELFFNDELEPVFNEEGLREEFALTITLTDIDRSVLQLLEENPKLTTAELSEALETSEDVIKKSIKRLENNGGLDTRTETIDGEDVTERVPTKDAKAEISTDPPEEEFEVVYRYTERPDVPPAKEGSRDFCRRLIALNRVYTRDEIDSLSVFTEHKQSVWTRRGGFYHNPLTGRTSPSCRHFWQQELIRK
jgi:DNA-binding Lrp family transcriptional regulator